MRAVVRSRADPCSTSSETTFPEMPLPRLHLFELEDQLWFPDLLRRGMTDYLATVTARTAPYAPVVPALTQLLADQHTLVIRDYCSGGGGPWVQLLPALGDAAPDLRLELSDAFPNVAALESFPVGAPVSYRCTPLRPTDDWPSDASLATFFSSFHHFRPADAREILRQASVTKTPVAIFEATYRSVAALALMCIVPVVVLLLTPTIRPVRWWRLLFTSLLPGMYLIGVPKTAAEEARVVRRRPVVA